jgi:hypothetical protein
MPSEQETVAVVELARKAALSYGQLLPDFICTEVVHRDLHPDGESRTHDTLTIKLSYYQHHEDHQLLLINGEATSLDYTMLNGAVPVGEFGAALLEIFDPASHTEFTWEKWTQDHKRPAGVYAYQVSAANSRYTLTYRAGTGQHQVLVGFHGVVEADRTTGEVLHYTYVADRPPRGFPVRSSATSVDYDRANIDGVEYLLPAVSETQMRSLDGWALNRAEFREYRKFSADSKVTFGTGK